MFQSIGKTSPSWATTLSEQVCPDKRYERNEQEDLKKAIDHMYEFKHKINELHPNVSQYVDHMLQRQRY